jgi:hypothetical protein
MEMTSPPHGSGAPLVTVTIFTIAADLVFRTVKRQAPALATGTTAYK